MYGELVRFGAHITNIELLPVGGWGSRFNPVAMLHMLQDLLVHSKGNEFEVDIARFFLRPFFFPLQYQGTYARQQLDEPTASGHNPPPHTHTHTHPHPQHLRELVQLTPLFRDPQLLH